MRRIAPLVLVVAALAVTAASASAKAGNGAYEPFPTPAADSHATGFYGDLGIDLTPQALLRGVYAKGQQPARPSSAPAERAALVPAPSGVWALVAVLLLAGGVALGSTFRRHRVKPVQGDSPSGPKFTPGSAKTV